MVRKKIKLSVNNYAFTMIELLSVIVVLAIVLSIAIPGISNMISASTKKSFTNDAQMLLKAIEYQKLNDESFDLANINKETVVSILNLSNENYKSVTATIDGNKLFVVIVGKGKWEGFVVYGTRGNIIIQNAENYSGDIRSPIVTLVGDQNVVINVGDSYVDSGATAIDDVDGDITSSIQVSSTLNPYIAGDYVITYTAVDSSGNVGTSTRTVTVNSILATATTESTVNNIISNSAIVGGTIIADGGSNIIERGFVFGTGSSPTIDNSKVIVSGALGSFSSDLSNLTSNTTYYVRAYATNGVGVSYGNEINFKTGFGGIDQHTVLMMHMDGTHNGKVFIDEIGKTVTPYGDTSTKTDVKKFGTASAYFDGNGDYATIGTTTSFNFTGDYTIDFWIKDLAAVPNGGVSGLFTNMSYSYGYWNGQGVNFRVETNNSVSLYFYTNGIYTNDISLGIPPLNTSQWRHIAMVKSGSTAYGFVDGILSGTLTVPSITATTSPHPLTLAKWAITGEYSVGYTRFYIDELRISQVARWTSNFTPPTEPYTP